MTTIDQEEDVLDTERLSDKQRQYLTKAGDPEIDQIDEEGWMLVARKPENAEVAAVASFERTTGHKVEFLDTYVWVDRRGCEHFGPGEIGYDRFELNA